MLPERQGPTMLLPPALSAELMRCRADYYRALALPTDTHAEQATRATDLASVCARTADTWRALARWRLAPGSGARWMLVSAAMAARRSEMQRAHFWREAATFWRSYHSYDVPDGAARHGGPFVGRRVS